MSMCTMLDLKGGKVFFIIRQEKLWKHFGMNETDIPRHSVQLYCHVI